MSALHRARGRIILETARLRLREMNAADAPLILEVLNEPAFIHFVADRGVRTLAQAADYIETRFVPSYALHGFGFYAVELRANDEAIGMCGLIKRETLEDVDIGFSILERYWGKGYASEAARALFAHGKEVLGLPRIVGITAPANTRSIHVLEKLGLRYERMVQLPGYAHEGKLFA